MTRATRVRGLCTNRARMLAVVLTAAPCVLSPGGEAGAQSYRVHATPVESPNHGPRTLVAAPHSASESPFGWHDTDAVAGAEFSTLRGNNVHVYLDVNNDHLPDGTGPDGGSALVFDHPVDFASPPSSYYDALATNAFYWTNRLHDIYAHHGFTSARGNMQQNTYGGGGIGNDPILVEVAKGGQTNNVVPVPAPDGTSPRIRNYVWTLTNPARESSFDASTLAWAYTYLAHYRLTSGCSNPGETTLIGFSDFVALLVTTDFHTASPSAPRGLGTYLLGQATHGPGIRNLPYSTDLAVFPRTYANLPALGSPFETGTVWAAALWDLTWDMVARHGASHDLLDGDGAENRMLRLVIEAMDTMPCPTGFVSARDSLLAADQTLHAGENQCMIWNAFARRGLGAGASQGTTNSISDQVPSFAMPVDCVDVFRNGFE